MVLINIYNRTFHPTDAEYTFSSAHGTFSRMTTIGHKASLSKFSRIKIAQCIFLENQGMKPETCNSIKFQKTHNQIEPEQYATECTVSHTRNQMEIKNSRKWKWQNNLTKLRVYGKNSTENGNVITNGTKNHQELLQTVLIQIMWLSR